MDRAAISTKKAPTALVLNSQAIVAGEVVFCSGTVGVDPETVLVRDGIEAPTEQVVVNLAAILDAAEASMTSLSRPPSFVWMSRTSRPSTRYTAATCAIPTSPFRTSQRRPPRDLLISIDAMAIKTNA
jgi:2-iminobutanoate/2-iminopropanoate deaminase